MQFSHIATTNLANVMQPIQKSREQFLSDGYLHAPGALDALTLQLALDCWQWSMANPGPRSARLLTDRLVRAESQAAAREVDSSEPGFFYQDISNPLAFQTYEGLLRSTAISTLLQQTLGLKRAWFLGEQVFLKDQSTPATGWHQDISDISASGDDLIVLWIPFDAVDQATSLGLVQGSHRGPVFSSIYGDYRDGDIPQPVEHASFACNPGDVVIFHMGCLHGAAPTRAGQTRRALALRFVGDDAYFTSRTNANDPRNGKPFRTSRMRQVL
jgi:ectoine hydroxylase-related dioxygenase (phytanoyl-CoA dioxygenase family)